MFKAKKEILIRNSLAYFASLLKTKKKILIRNSLAYFASLLTTKKESLFKLSPDARMTRSAVVHALKKSFEKKYKKVLKK